jgi:hypothetical protein
VVYKLEMIKKIILHTLKTKIYHNEMYIVNVQSVVLYKTPQVTHEPICLTSVIDIWSRSAFGHRILMRGCRFRRRKIFHCF